MGTLLVELICGEIEVTNQLFSFRVSAFISTGSLPGHLGKHIYSRLWLDVFVMSPAFHKCRTQVSTLGVESQNFYQLRIAPTSVRKIELNDC